MRTTPALVAIVNTALTCHFLWWKTSSDRRSQQTRPDDNIGCTETKATFRA